MVTFGEGDGDDEEEEDDDALKWRHLPPNEDCSVVVIGQGRDFLPGSCKAGQCQ